MKFCKSEQYQAFYVYGRIQLNFSAFPAPENAFIGTHHNHHPSKPKPTQGRTRCKILNTSHLKYDTASGRILYEGKWGLLHAG